MVAAALLNLRLQPAQRVQLAPGNPVNQPQQHRQHQQQHGNQAAGGAPAGLGALVQRVGQLQPDTAFGFFQGVDAVVLGVVKALLQRGGKCLLRRSARAQQQAALGIAQLQRERLGVVGAGHFAQDAHRLRLRRFGGGGGDIEQRGVELAVGAFDQFGIEVVLNLRIHIPGHQGGADAPDQHHGGDQWTGQARGQAAGGARRVCRRLHAASSR